MRPFKSSIQMGDRLPMDAVRDLAQNYPTEFLAKVQKGADDGTLRLEKMDLRSMYQMLAGVEVKVPMEIHGATRSITTSAMPILTGVMALAGINDAYEGVESVGAQLVTEMDDPKKVTTLATLDATDSNIDEVKETGEFPEIGLVEEAVEIRHKKNGRKLSLSVESFLENEIGNIGRKLNLVGTIAAEWVEEQTIKRVTDHDGSKSSAAEPYVYRPTTGAAALFSATANTPGTRAPSGTRITTNAFVDESDLEANRVRMASFKNVRGKRISIPRSQIKIFCPDAVVGAVMKTLNSEYVPGVENEVSNWGPKGRWNIPQERVISTPKLDDLSTSAWYYGAPQQMFVRKWKMRFEYVELGQTTQMYLTNQIAFQCRIAWDCEIGALDYIGWIQNLSASTAPADE